MKKNKPEANYFFVNRNLLHSDRWLSEPFTRGQAWIDLFGLAQHSRGFFRVRGIRVDVRRGQLAYSQVSLAKRWKWSRNKVRRYLDEVEKHGDVIQQKNEITTIITVVKYDQWQGSDTASDTAEGQQKDSRRTANDTHTKKNKNVKNDKNTLCELGSQEIISIFEIFQNGNNPTIHYGNKTNRKAAMDMIKKFGLTETVRLAEYAVSLTEVAYAPVITTPYQLKQQVGKLRAFYSRNKSSGIAFIS